MYLYAHMQGLRIRAGRPIHEMGISHIFDGKGLDMRNRTTLLRAEQRLTAPFLRSAGRMKRNTVFVMDNRRT